MTQLKVVDELRTYVNTTKLSMPIPRVGDFIKCVHPASGTKWREVKAVRFDFSNDEKAEIEVEVYPS